MQELLALWLPIILATVVVFIASMLAWTVLPHHSPDFRKLPDEDRLLEIVRSNNVTPGEYMFPYIAPADMKKPEAQERYKAGPHGLVRIWAQPNMGRNLGLTFAFFIIANIFIAYITSAALDPGAAYLSVFQIAGTAALMTYCFGHILNAIWFTRPLRAVMMDLLDGIAYALLTAGIFGWLWP